jgi:hypothetical protein
LPYFEAAKAAFYEDLLDNDAEEQQGTAHECQQA